MPKNSEMEDKVHCLSAGTYEAASVLQLNSATIKHVEHDEAEPVVIGGMVLDINAIPSVPAKPRTTTPGKVLYASGGVGRNVAECMSKLGAKPYMISAVGVDMAGNNGYSFQMQLTIPAIDVSCSGNDIRSLFLIGNLLLEHWKSCDLSTEGIRRHQDIETAVVCSIFDGKGELAAAVAHVESVEIFLTPGWIEKFKCKIHSAPLLMIDANLSLPSLETACQLAAKCNTPVWFEPVSVVKSKRVVSVAKYVTFASPNEDELVAMANALSTRNVFSPIKREDIGKLAVESLFCLLRPAILVLLNSGIKVVLTTLGSDGVLLCFKWEVGFRKLRFARGNSFSRQLCETVNASFPPNSYINVPKSKADLYAIHFPAISASVVRLTGAGDCFVGGTVASLCAGLDVMQSVAVGIAAAKASVESESNVPVEYCFSKIADDARVVYSGARYIFCSSKL